MSAFPGPSQPGTTSRTAVQPAASEQQPETSTQPPPGVLHLRGAHGRNGRSVQWAEGTVDNEGLNRKKSKVCCIYHRPRAVDESSDSSSSSDSDSDSDSSDPDSDGGKAARGDADRAFRNQRPGAAPRRAQPHSHRHAPDCPDHGHEHGHQHRHHSHPDPQQSDGDDDEEKKDPSGRPSRRQGKGKSPAKRKPSPNAYEKMPKYDKPANPGV